MNLKDYIADIQDFPKEGILFRDITPLMQNGEAFKEATSQIQAFAKEVGAELIAGPESRGFIFGCPVAVNLGIGFVPVRKPNKLPRETISYKYDLEYGSNELHMHKDAVKRGQKVLIVDDLLATGGTVQATIKMVEDLGGEVVGCAFLIELEALKGRELLNGYNVFTVMQY
ncbi:MAG: adenine phosphoribosyltransferase [Erysipelotrichaceae bacterium]|nr:adenine phosphoribosyltransferase [Erysipelotrichaceae bacterium]